MTDDTTGGEEAAGGGIPHCADGSVNCYNFVTNMSKGTKAKSVATP